MKEGLPQMGSPSIVGRGPALRQKRLGPHWTQAPNAKRQAQTSIEARIQVDAGDRGLRQ
jgi:hypothetical protein